MKNCLLYPYNIHLAWCTSGFTPARKKLGDKHKKGAKIEAIILI
jgi:hypothetical protein